MRNEIYRAEDDQAYKIFRNHFEIRQKYSIMDFGGSDPCGRETKQKRKREVSKMKEYSVVMAAVDFVPVILFVLAAAALLRGVCSRMNRGLYSVFTCGAIDVAAAGGLKALYKLLYAAGVCDFEALSAIFMPLQSIGFLLAGAALLIFAIREGRAAKAANETACAAAVAAPPAFSGTFVFITMMVAGLGAMVAGLMTISCRAKKTGAAVLFAVSFLCSLCMGYLSSQDFELALYNWIAEGVNIVGQGTLLLGALAMKSAAKADAE